MKEDRPYGSCPSQLTSEQLANGATRLSEARAFNGEVLWLEGRPAEAGRTALVKFDGASCETLGPDDLNVRTLVHEYGGGGWLRHMLEFGLPRLKISDFGFSTMTFVQ